MVLASFCYVRKKQYLNRREDGGDASPYWDWTFPHQDWASPIEIWAKVDEKKKTHKVRSNIEPNCAGIVMQKKTVQPPAKTFFFCGDHVFLARKKPWIWDFSQQKKRLKFGKDLFFGDHMFLAGKNPWLCDFGQKKRLNLGEDLFFFEIKQNWIKLSKKPPLPLRNPGYAPDLH